MFVYFNKEGVIKEIINDSSIRQGNSNVNTVYFFIEGADPQTATDNNGLYYKALFFSLGRYTMYLLDEHGEPLPSIEGESFDVSTVKMEVPYDKKKELKYFKYFTRYEMFQLPIPQEVLNYKGTVGLKFQMINNDAINTQGLIVFNIEGTSPDLEIAPDTAITIAEWNYLLANMLTPGDVYTKAEANSTFQEKLIAGENIKTINGESILGSGDLEVQGAGETAEWGNITGTLSDQTDLQNALNAKQNTLTFDNTPTDGSSNPVTSDGIYDAVQNVREVAEGKCRTIVLSYGQTIADLKSTISQSTNVRVSDLDKNDITQDIVDGNYDSVQVVNSSFNSNGNIIFLLAQTDGNDNYIIFTTDGYLYNFVVAKVSDLYTKDFIKSGDIFLITQTEVPDRWVGFIKSDIGVIRLDKLETSKIDLANYVTTNTNQTITGEKTFTNKIKLRNDDYTYIDGSNGIITISSINGEIKSTSNFLPTSNILDLGSGNLPWKRVFLSNNQEGACFLTTISTYYSLSTDINNNLNFTLPSGTRAIRIDLDGNFISMNGKDLGENDHKWKDLYLSGKAYLPNNSTIETGSGYIGYTYNNLFYMAFGNSGVVFYKTVLPNSNNAQDLGKSGKPWRDLYLSGKASFSSHISLAANSSDGSRIEVSYDNVPYLEFRYDGIRPQSYYSPMDLGSSSTKWQNLYLSGNLSDGANSIAVANIANKNNFVTLTQAQYDALATKDPDTFYFIEE